MHWYMAFREKAWGAWSEAIFVLLRRRKTYPGLRELWTGSQNICATLDTWDVDIRGGGEGCHNSATQLVHNLTSFWGESVNSPFNGWKCSTVPGIVYFDSSCYDSLLNWLFKILLQRDTDDSWWYVVIRPEPQMFIFLHLFWKWTKILTWHELCPTTLCLDTN